MSADVSDLRAFYASPLGLVAHALVGRLLRRIWSGRLSGLSLLGLGYAVPFLPPLAAETERVLAFMPSSQGVVNWPAIGPSSSALADPTMMPLAEAAVDRVLVVHALEVVDSPADLLAEVWRILTPGGRMILVAPNRRGLWSRMDTTPFGQGQPFSRSQLRHLMRETLFSPDQWAETLYIPPFRSRVLLRSAHAWERLGGGLGLPFAGLHVVEATKQLHRPILVRERRRVLRPAPILLPVPAS